MTTKVLMTDSGHFVPARVSVKPSKQTYDDVQCLLVQRD